MRPINGPWQKSSRDAQPIHERVAARAILVLLRQFAGDSLPDNLRRSFPPTSGVRYSGVASTSSIAFRSRPPLALRQNDGASIAPDQICPIGLAISFSGDCPEPTHGTGSNIEGYLRSGFKLAEGSISDGTGNAGPRSERMSPKRFDPTTTSTSQDDGQNETVRNVDVILIRPNVPKLFADDAESFIQNGIV